MVAVDSPRLSAMVDNHLYHRNAPTIVRAVASLVEQRAAEPVQVLVVTSGGDGAAGLVRARFADVTVLAHGPRAADAGGDRRASGARLACDAA